MNTTNTRISMASAAALFALASFATLPTAFAADQTAPCYGVNSCKGTSDCKSGDHSCKGQNSCKGQGFKALSSKDCAAQHGSTTAPQK